jgi:hypothetical protein
MMNDLETIVKIALQAHEYIHGNPDSEELEVFELELRRRLMKKYCTIATETSSTHGSGATAKFNILHG